MSRRPRHAFTLIEVLLAIAIAAAVVTLSVSLFSTTSQTLRGQEQRLSGDVRTLEAYMQLERDLLQTVPALGSSNLVFLLEAPESNQSESSLKWTTLQRLPGEDDLRWTELVRVHYFVNDRGELIREARRDTGPPDFPGSRDILLEEVKMFRLEALYAGEAYSEWPQKDEEALPDGVAVRLLPGDGEGMEGKVLVPAGMVIQPTLERGTLLEASGPSGGN